MAPVARFRHATAAPAAPAGHDPFPADQLFLSPATVRNHIQNILNKLEVHSRVQAVALVLRRR